MVQLTVMMKTPAYCSRDVAIIETWSLVEVRINVFIAKFSLLFQL